MKGLRLKITIRNRPITCTESGTAEQLREDVRLVDERVLRDPNISIFGNLNKRLTPDQFEMDTHD